MTQGNILWKRQKRNNCGRDVRVGEFCHLPICRWEEELVTILTHLASELDKKKGRKYRGGVYFTIPFAYQLEPYVTI